VNNSGLRIQPKAESEPHFTADDRMFAREDEKAREAVAKFEEWLKRQPPG
jgi:hypothetical protein